MRYSRWGKGSYVVPKGLNVSLLPHNASTFTMKDLPVFNELQYIRNELIISFPWL